MKTNDVESGIGRRIPVHCRMPYVHRLVGPHTIIPWVEHRSITVPPNKPSIPYHLTPAHPIRKDSIQRLLRSHRNPLHRRIQTNLSHIPLLLWISGDPGDRLSFGYVAHLLKFIYKAPVRRPITVGAGAVLRYVGLRWGNGRDGGTYLPRTHHQRIWP